jgi:MinD superfamily P-loop ATPase
MVTICWAVKGGSGTTVVASALALTTPRPTLLVDLDGEIPRVLGIPEPDRPGSSEWATSPAPASHLDDLLVNIGDGRELLPWRAHSSPRPTLDDLDPGRLAEFARWIGQWRARTTSPQCAMGSVIVDAGTGEPPPELVDDADRLIVVTRPCYLALNRLPSLTTKPTGVVLVREPGRSLTARDVETSAGAPVVATVDYDPAVARAVDSGLLMNRLPSQVRRELRAVAA